MTFEEYRDRWWERERRQDRNARDGIIGDQRFGFCYVGPQLVLTSERTIESAWLTSVAAHAHAFHSMILARAMRRPEDGAHVAHVREWFAAFMVTK
jgi:hypothetical protein